MPKVELPDGTIVQLPDRASPELLREIDSIQEKRSYTWGEAISKAPSALPGSLAEAGKGMYGALRRPVTTFKGFSESASGGFQALAKKLGIEGVSQQDIPHFKETADAFGGAYYEALAGDSERLKRMIAENPAQPLLDLSSLLSGGASLAAKTGKLGKVSRGLKTAAEVTNPIGLGMKAMGTVTKPISERMWRRAAEFKPEKFVPSEQKRLSRKALDEGMTISRKGVTHGEGVVGKLDNEISDFLSAKQAAGETIPSSSAVAKIQDIRKHFKEMKGQKPALKKVGKEEARFLDDVGAEMGVLEAHKSKKARYKEYAETYGKIENKDIVPIPARVSKKIAHGLRDALVNKYPELAKLGDEADMVNITKTIEKTLNKHDARHPFLTAIRPIFYGGALGGITQSPAIGAIAGLAYIIDHNPVLKSQIAVALEKTRKVGGAVTRPGYKAAYQASKAPREDTEKSQWRELLDMFKHGMSY